MSSFEKRKKNILRLLNEHPLIADDLTALVTSKEYSNSREQLENARTRLAEAIESYNLAEIEKWILGIRKSLSGSDAAKEVARMHGIPIFDLKVPKSLNKPKSEVVKAAAREQDIPVYDFKVPKDTSRLRDWLKRKWVRGLLAGIAISILGFLVHSDLLVGYGGGITITSIIFAD